jgi:hypothetical protein
MSPELENAIRSACERLAIAFAHAVDHREVDKVVDLFTEDGVFERKGETLSGRAAIRAAQDARPSAVVTRHVCSPSLIDVISERAARGVVYFLLYRHERLDGAPPGPVPLQQPQILGEYHDEYERTDQGWKIARRTAKAVFRSID